VCVTVVPLGTDGAASPPTSAEKDMTMALKFGTFMARFRCPPGQDPTAAYMRDLKVIQHMDELGFDEAWVGEHHSAGHELIPDSMSFIAWAAPQTKHIKLGTGVLSLPHHNPLWVADRARVPGPAAAWPFHARSRPWRPPDRCHDDRHQP